MSKISSKLAAGVRKIKTGQQADEGPTKPVESAPAEKPQKNRRRQPGKVGDLHPARIWPD